MRWLITNRNQDTNDGFGSTLSPLTYWTRPDGTGNIASRATWTKLSLSAFQKQLSTAAANFPDPITTNTADQKHVTLFVHGYNEAWTNSSALYEEVTSTLFDGPNSLGELVSFDWPSRGSLLGYLPDRSEARQTGDDLTNVLSELYEWVSDAQAAAAKNPDNACKARTSIIAHSMGNYALQYAMNALWTRKNRPLLVSLLQEVLMVAADVDNDIFGDGEQVSTSDGEGLANLSYRITALFSGRDDVLGCSAGLKHFGKRRLGRAGLDRTYPLPDNVWDVDCSTLMAPTVGGLAIHSEYFDPNGQVVDGKSVYSLMRALLQGYDRSILIANGQVPSGLTRTQPLS